MNAQHRRSEAEISELPDEESAVVSAGTIYLKTDGLDGQVTTEGFNQWIDGNGEKVIRK